jgi:hypothetical protein
MYAATIDNWNERTGINRFRHHFITAATDNAHASPTQSELVGKNGYGFKICASGPILAWGAYAIASTSISISGNISATT